MDILNKLNRYLRRNYVFEYNPQEQILTIKNTIHVYELLMIRAFIFRNRMKVKDIRVDG